MLRHKAVTTTMLQRTIKALPLADLLRLARGRGINLLEMSRLDVEHAVGRNNGPSLRIAVWNLVGEVLLREETDQKKARSKPGAKSQGLGDHQQNADE